MPLKMHRVPQEALSGTECHKHDAVTSCGADYRVINTIITDIRLMEAAWDKKQPLCGKTSATFSKNCGNFHAVFYICAE